MELGKICLRKDTCNFIVSKVLILGVYQVIKRKCSIGIHIDITKTLQTVKREGHAERPVEGL